MDTQQIRFWTVFALIFALFACGQHPNDIGPGTDPPPSLCALAGHRPPTDEFPANNAVCVPGGATPCDCANYAGVYPPDVYDPDTTITAIAFRPDAGNFDPEGRIKGCSGITRFAWPDCASLAEVSGVVIHEPERNFGIAGDHDLSFNICPDMSTMLPDPFTSPNAIELRGTGSWPGAGVNGRIHVEVQDCRFFNGEWTVVEPAPVDVTFTQPARPGAGETVSVAGDWISDIRYSEDSVNQRPFTEIHEARIIAVTRALTDAVSYSFVSAFFAEQSRQQDEIVLDIKLPPAPNFPGTLKLNCELVGETAQPGDPTAQNLTPVGERTCLTTAIVDPIISSPGTGTCRLHLSRQDAFPAHGFNCQGTCGQPLADFLQCDQLAAVLAVRAEWSDPADLWECASCACQDPSAPGAFITAPVQGCVAPGLDPANPADQATACASVCGGVICGAAPACVIGECQAPAQGGVARVVGRSACDPAIQPRARVTPAGDWRVTVVAPSAATFNLGGDSTGPHALTGEFVINISSDGLIADFAEALLAVEPFSVDGHDVTEGAIFTGQRLAAAFLDDTNFIIPTGTAVFGLRGRVDGEGKGLNGTNPEALTGWVDLDQGTFFLHITATDPEEGNAITADVYGTVDNVPPTANAGGPVRTVECTSPTFTPVVLDASGSRDPDVGDLISHVQWFTNLGSAVGNMVLTTVQLPLGLSQFVLHAYDRKLGSDFDFLAVNVVDTTPPVLTVNPATLCLWPPKHRRVKFSLDGDIAAIATDVCDIDPVVRIVSVTSNEPDNGLGDGDTAGDVAFSDRAFCVRKERSGTGKGRRYTVTIEARDDSGNASTKDIVVNVPHDAAVFCRRDRGQPIAEGAPCE